MQNPLQITYHDMHHSEDLETLIKEKYAKILHENPDVTKCHVVLEKQSKHHQKANLALVRLDLKISRLEDVVVTEKCFEDLTSVKSAVLKAFKEALDLTRKHKQRRLDQKRVPLGELTAAEPVDTGDE